MAGVLSAAGLTLPQKREYGHWSEVVSSAGKVYYYNRVTEQSQWIKPDGWEKAESVIFPVIDRLQRSREESGFSDTIQTDCAMSEDEMDLSDGNSPIDMTSSSNSSIEERSESSIENEEEEDVIEDEGEPYTPTDKYYRADLVVALDEKFPSSEMNVVQSIQSSCAFEIEFASQQTQMYRARALARTAMAKALESQTEVSTLSIMQQHMEDSRQYFQANFDTEMRRILRGPDTQEKIEADKNEKKKRIRSL